MRLSVRPANTGCPAIVAEKLAKTKLAIAVIDHHIEILEAMLSYLVQLQNQRRDWLLVDYDKKIATVKKEIEVAQKHRQKLINLNEKGIEYVDWNFY